MMSKHPTVLRARRRLMGKRGIKRDPGCDFDPDEIKSQQNSLRDGA
jgi:hypothetical protein